MQHSLAAIRSGRSATHYFAQSVRPRQRRLGLRRDAYVAAAARPPTRRPVDALRAAARGHVIAPAATRVVRRSEHARLSWSRPFEAGLRRARPRSAAPWRA